MTLAWHPHRGENATFRFKNGLCLRLELETRRLRLACWAVAVARWLQAFLAFCHTAQNGRASLSALQTRFNLADFIFKQQHLCFVQHGKLIHPIHRGMVIPAQFGCPASQNLARLPHGFSLIEVTIALGVFAFAMIPIIGLVSSGMKSLRGSMDDGVRGEIVRKVVAEAGRVPYTNLSTAFNNRLFYFDDEGVQQALSNAQTIFVASNSIANPTPLVTSDTNIAQLLRVTVRHFADTNNKTVYSQLILNTAQ